MGDLRKTKHWSKVIIALSIVAILVWIAVAIYMVKEYPAMRGIFFMLAIQASD